MEAHATKQISKSRSKNRSRANTARRERSARAGFSMTFGQKLARLCDERSIAKTKASVLAGLPKTAIGDCISKGYIPRADTAFRIAQVLGVSVDFLIDESQDVPKSAQPHAERLTPREALHVLADHLATLIEGGR